MLQLILMTDRCSQLPKHTFGLKISKFLFSWARAIKGHMFMGFDLTLWSFIVQNLIFEVSLPTEQEKRLTLNEHDDGDDDDEVSLPRI